MAVTPFNPPYKNPLLHANFSALSSIEPELLPIEVLQCGNQEFALFWSCDVEVGNPYIKMVSCRIDILNVTIFKYSLHKFR